MSFLSSLSKYSIIYVSIIHNGGFAIILYNKYVCISNRYGFAYTHECTDTLLHLLAMVNYHYSYQTAVILFCTLQHSTSLSHGEGLTASYVSFITDSFI